MPSTYLQLTNKLLRYLNETELDSSNFASARGIHATAKDAILDTIDEINQKEQTWPFNIAAGSQTLTVGQEEYSWPADLLVPDWESFYIERSVSLSVNTTPLNYLNREEWMRYARPDDFDSTSTGLRKPEFVFWDDGGFGVTPSPDQAYVVKFDYYKIPTQVSAHGDTVLIPTTWNYVIQAGALAKMNLFKENVQGQQIADNKYDKYLNQMRAALISRPDNFVDTRVNFGGNRYSTVGYFQSS